MERSIHSIHSNSAIRTTDVSVFLIPKQTPRASRSGIHERGVLILIFVLLFETRPRLETRRQRASREHRVYGTFRQSLERVDDCVVSCKVRRGDTLLKRLGQHVFRVVRVVSGTTRGGGGYFKAARV